MKKTAVVTGSSSGFGLLITIELARKGYRVIATMRNMQKSSVFKSYTNEKEVMDRINPFYLDVTNSASIEAMKEYILEFDSIDILVNNAGLAVGGFAEEMEMDEYRRQFDTNVFGVMAVTKAILPIMREQKYGKIINMGSISGLVGFPGLSAYVSAKHALEGYSESLRLEVRQAGIDVALIEPGSFKTNIWSSGMEVNARSQAKDSPYYQYMQKLMGELEQGEKSRGDPMEVAELVCRLAEKDKIKKLRHPIGRGVKAMTLLKTFLPWQVWEKLVLNRIFNENRDK